MSPAALHLLYVIGSRPGARLDGDVIQRRHSCSYRLRISSDWCAPETLLCTPEWREYMVAVKVATIFLESARAGGVQLPLFESVPRRAA